MNLKFTHQQLRLGMIVVAVLAVLYVLSAALPAKVRQPVQFNHYVHTKKNELPCTTCHLYVEAETYAGKPKIEICANCHSEPMSKSSEEKKVVGFVKQNKDIPWERLYRFRLNIFFSHRKHVVEGKVDCVECHGNMPDRKTPPSRPLTQITMNKCVGCHEKKNIQRDCNDCHR